MNPLRWLYVVVALVCVGLGTTAVLTYRHAVTEAAQIAPLKAQLSDLQNNYATLAKAVADRDAAAAVVRKDRATVSNKLDEVQRDKSTPAASWLDTRIPDDVRRVYGGDQTKPPQR